MNFYVEVFKDEWRSFAAIVGWWVLVGALLAVVLRGWQTSQPQSKQTSTKPVQASLGSQALSAAVFVLMLIFSYFFIFLRVVAEEPVPWLALFLGTAVAFIGVAVTRHGKQKSAPLLLGLGIIVMLASVGYMSYGFGAFSFEASDVVVASESVASEDAETLAESQTESSPSVFKLVLTVMVLAFGIWRLIGARKPKVWLQTFDPNSGKAIKTETIHWFGLIGCVLWHVALLVGIWWSAAGWAWFLLPVAWVLSGIYIVDIRQLLVMRLFQKPLFKDHFITRFIFFDFIHLKKREKRKEWLENGLHFTLMPSWFPGMDMIVIKLEKIEIDGDDGYGAKAPFQPTRSTESESKSATGGIVKNTIPGASVQVVYKFTGRRYNPKKYLEMADEDRATDEAYQQVLIRQVNATLAYLNRQIMFGDAVTGNLCGMSMAEAAILAAKSGVILFKDKDGCPLNFYEYLRDVLNERAGFELLSFEVIVVNMPPDIQKSVNEIKDMEIEVQKALLEIQKLEAQGQADGARIAATVQTLAKSIGTDGQTAYAHLILQQMAQGTNKVFFPAEFASFVGKLTQTGGDKQSLPDSNKS